MIKLVNVSKNYTLNEDTVTAVRDVSLTIHMGEMFGIIGYSGAGKSTLIRCINMLETPSSGQVFIENRDLTKLAPAELRAARQQVGMIFQQFNLLSCRTVAGNVAFPLEIAGHRPEEIKQRVQELLHLVGLSDKAQAYPSQLSGGQKQRVGIARALANHPKVLLCDEATSSLDPQTTQSVLLLLKEINRVLGLTVVLVTHEMPVVKAVCDRVAVMEQGRLVELGTVEKVFARPESLTARQFFYHTTMGVAANV